MEVFKGNRINDGIAFGKIAVINKGSNDIVKREVSDTDYELERLKKSVEKAKDEIQSLYEKVKSETGVDEAMILEAQKILLEDEEILASFVKKISEENVSAEYAVYITGKKYVEFFDNLADDYMKERALDVKDVIKRLIRILSPENKSEYKLKQDSIILADDLTPSETVQMEKEKLKGIVILKGSHNSHTAILARTYNIPALIKTHIENISCYEGAEAIVDGEEGIIYINPDKSTIRKLKEKLYGYKTRCDSLMKYKNLDDITIDGKEVKVCANAGSLRDIEKALEQGTSGIGLFRSEFVYLNEKDFPSEEKQFEIYKKAAVMLKGKRLVIRTLDIGGDKTADYFKFEDEDNPALGYRAIRYCLDNPLIFETQLRAIYRASAYGNIAVMFPMITSLEEVTKIKEYIEKIKSGLDKSNINYGKVETGIMIETPAASIISDLLAKEVDFFSIGTNDLTQYTLAADRQNPIVDKCFDTHHPAIFRQIQMIVSNAHNENIRVSICGELASDEDSIQKLILMGIDGLSVPPSKVLGIRKKVRESYRR